MNTPSTAMPDSPLDSQGIAPTVMAAARPMYWSLRRELWENHSIYIAPLAAAAVAMFGFLISLIWLPHKMRALSVLDPAQQHDAITMPFHFAAGSIMVTAFIVSIFYSLDALYGERRDRSILFWKSLPVSDLTTVLSKASIPLFVLPLLAFVITAITQSIMLLFGSLVLLANGLSVAPLWTQLQLHQSLLLLLYHLVTAHMLWYAPFYAWFLLVSVWARRAPFLWAVLPPLVIGIFEKIAFHSSHFAAQLHDRFSGGSEAGASMMGDPFTPGVHLSPGAFLASQSLWIGLAFAAIFLAAAVRLRRYREPI